MSEMPEGHGEHFAASQKLPKSHRHTPSLASATGVGIPGRTGG